MGYCIVVKRHCWKQSTRSPAFRGLILVRFQIHDQWRDMSKLFGLLNRLVTVSQNEMDVTVTSHEHPKSPANPLLVQQLVAVNSKESVKSSPYYSWPFVRTILRGLVDSPPKGPVMRKCFHVITLPWTYSLPWSSSSGNSGHTTWFSKSSAIFLHDNNCHTRRYIYRSAFLNGTYNLPLALLMPPGSCLKKRYILSLLGTDIRSRALRWIRIYFNKSAEATHFWSPSEAISKYFCNIPVSISFRLEEKRNIDDLMHKSRNSSVLAMEFRLFYI